MPPKEKNLNKKIHVCLPMVTIDMLFFLYPKSLAQRNRVSCLHWRSPNRARRGPGLSWCQLPKRHRATSGLLGLHSPRWKTSGVFIEVPNCFRFTLIKKMVIHPGRFIWNIIMEVWKILSFLNGWLVGPMLIFQGVVHFRLTWPKLYTKWRFITAEFQRPLTLQLPSP